MDVLYLWLCFHCVDTQHQFNEQEIDWGFTSFTPLDTLNDPRRGYLVNDTVEVTCEVDEKDTAEHLRVSRYSYVLYRPQNKSS